MTVLFILILALYVFLIFFLISGFRKASMVYYPTRLTGISVIIPCRNEERNLHTLLQSILAQDYPREQLQIIVVDDHSEDRTAMIMKEWCNRHPQIVQIALPQEAAGKKAALQAGVARATFPVILTTDADCIPGKRWLKSISSCFGSDVKMVIGLVKLVDRPGFFARMQSSELMALAGSTAGAAALGHPVMCNGANLAFLKEVFLEVEGYEGNMHIASGDDEFLMRKVRRKYPKGIVALTEPDSAVETKAQSSAGLFLHQRIRWASKWRVNDDAWTRALATLIPVSHLAFIASLPLAAISFNELLIFLLAAKVMVEAIFVAMVSIRLKQRFDELPFLAWQLLYPFYVLFVGIASLTRSYSWKGRNYRM